MTLQPHERILVALDTNNLARARELVDALHGKVGGFKIGKEFFTHFGPQGVAEALRGAPFFLDLKYHDIPNTVAGAVRAALAMGAFMLNVHASGGAAMMRAAVAALEGAARRPLLIGVTVLTSMDESDLAAVGQQGPAEAQVLRLARLAQGCGLDGVVASSREIETLRRDLGPDFKLVVPGLRPTWAESGDQKRVMTPSEAVSRGADYLVIGRPINAAKDPAAAAARIVDELSESTAAA